MSQGSAAEKAQEIADYESAKTTKLYECTSDRIALNEVEKIAI